MCEHEEPDRTRVDLSRQDHIDFWTRELGVGEAELRGAVLAAGGGVLAVRRYLGR